MEYMLYYDRTNDQKIAENIDSALNSGSSEADLKFFGSETGVLYLE